MEGLRSVSAHLVRYTGLCTSSAVSIASLHCLRRDIRPFATNPVTTGVASGPIQLVSMLCMSFTSYTISVRVKRHLSDVFH